jgi:environmental stress-induced protein Ves
MTLNRFFLPDLPATPWKNGGGVTREIACVPVGSGMADFDWRVSIAQIASDGPFSIFPGVDRVITLLEGGGVHLQTEDGHIEHRLDTPLAPFAFAGEAPVHARLLAGDCFDFNTMTRRAVCRASVQIVRAPTDWPTSTQGLFMSVQGRWLLEGQSPETLVSQQGLWWCDAALAWRLVPQDPGAALLALTFHYH